MKAFGVGCWSFEPANLSERSELETSRRKFAETVIATLSAIPTIKNVTVERIRLGALMGQSLEDEPHLEAGRSAHTLTRSRFRPHPVGGEIRFDVEVPAHFCSTHPLVSVLTRAVGDQHYKVILRYSENFPVVFVINETSPSADGSAGLVVLREFLLQELKLRDGEIKLRVLGPSPFWADLTVRVEVPDSLSAEGEISHTRQKVRVGYDDIDFIYRSSSATEDQALGRVIELIEPELSLYYQMKNWDQSRMLRATQIQHELEGLLSMYEGRGIRTVLKRWFVAGKRGRNLALSLVKEESRSAQELRRGLEEQEAIYATTNSTVFKSDLDARLDMERMDLGGAKGMVDLLDSRRRYEVNLAAVIISSTVGGVAGAAVTTIVGGGS